MNILIINGPNLNLLGLREPNIYGAKTLSDINKHLDQISIQLNITIAHFQSNHEGAIVDKIHEARNNVDYIIIIDAY